MLGTACHRASETSHGCTVLCSGHLGALGKERCASLPAARRQTPAHLLALTSRSRYTNGQRIAGYWAHFLRRAHVDVAAYDVCPPSPDNALENVFHGNLPTYTKIQLGGSKSVIKHVTSALFLCYPPPGELMAYNCIRRYRYAIQDRGSATVVGPTC